MQISYSTTCEDIIDTWLEIITEAGKDEFLSNNVGTLLDQVIWICLAEMAGDKYFNHPAIMRDKARRKVGRHSHFVERLVGLYRRLPVDCRVDLFGLNKLSVYPQVCAYGTVNDQLDLHKEPFDCSFSDGSPESLNLKLVRDEMFVYMRFLYIRIFQQSHKYCPGVVKPGCDAKNWHSRYKANGIPGDKWRECVDIDLSNTMPIAKPDFDSYLGLADSSCAPSDPSHYRSMGDYSNAPRYEKRKLLYLLQCPELPDISSLHNMLCTYGDNMQACHIEKVSMDLGISQDISTGTRFERQKPAGRPFYQLNAPLGCCISNLETSVRTFLRKVPQSLLAMSLKSRGEEALDINDPGFDIRERVLVSDDKEKYSPHMDPYSQMMTSDFFAEVTGDKSFKSCTNILLNNNLYYRVHGKLVYYPSNGTDREGLRGAQNTWLEIACHGYHTRMLREKGIMQDRTKFIGFIDDALRRYEKELQDSKLDVQFVHTVVSELEEKLRSIGRKLSWDKAYVSETLSTILGEVFFAGLPMGNGLKSFIMYNDVDEKVVEDLSSQEGNYASKSVGAMTASCPVPLAYYQYVHNTMKMHHRYGVRMDDRMEPLEYTVWCMTPIAFGGAGMRGPLELDCTEGGSRIAAGVGNMCRLSAKEPEFNRPFNNLFNGPFEELSARDFVRDPTQFHVVGPRIRSQRLNQFVRNKLPEIVVNKDMRALLMTESKSQARLEAFAEEMLSFANIDVQAVKAYYGGSAQSELDSIVNKVCNSDTVKTLISIAERNQLRKLVRHDAVKCSVAFRYRLEAKDIPEMTVVWKKRDEGE
jgi:hypothetical protein